MVDSRVVDRNVSQGAGATVGNVEGGAPTGPLVFLERDSQNFDSGAGLPSLALSGSGLVISVHSNQSNLMAQADFSYNLGQFTGSRPIVWGQGGTQFASGYGSMTVAINEQPINDDAGFVLTAYQHEFGGLYWSGALYTSTGKISWFQQDKYVCGITSTPLSAPAIALNNQGTVVIAYLQGSTLYSCVGALVFAQKNISWGDPQPVHENVTACALAINENGDVLLCYSTSTNSSPFLESAYGSLSANTKSINWSPHRRLTMTSVSGPLNLTLNDNGFAVVTAADPRGNPNYNVGQLGKDSSGLTTIDWQSTSGWPIPDLAGETPGVSVAANDSNQLALIWQDSGKYYFSGIAVA